MELVYCTSLISIGVLVHTVHRPRAAASAGCWLQSQRGSWPPSALPDLWSSWWTEQHRIALNNISAATSSALPVPSVLHNCVGLMLDMSLNLCSTVLWSIAPLLIVSGWDTGQMSHFNVGKPVWAELTSLGSCRIRRRGSQAVAKPSRLVLKNVFQYLKSKIPVVGWVTTQLSFWLFHTQTPQGLNIWRVQPLALHCNPFSVLKCMSMRACVCVCVSLCAK